MLTDDKIDYDFETDNLTDYTMATTMYAKSRMMDMIFHKSKIKIARQTGDNIKGSIDEVEGFDVPDQFHNLMRTILGSKLNSIFKEITKDYKKNRKQEFSILNVRVDKARFQRNKDKDWIIVIKWTGQYAIK